MHLTLAELNGRTLTRHLWLGFRVSKKPFNFFTMLSASMKTVSFEAGLFTLLSVLLLLLLLFSFYLLYISYAINIRNGKQLLYGAYFDGKSKNEAQNKLEISHYVS